MIDLETVRHIATLSRLKLDAEAELAAQRDLSKIVDYMDKLSELDTSGVEPTFAEAFDAESLREDQSVPSMPNEELLSNAPDQEDGAYRVPITVEE